MIGEFICKIEILQLTFATNTTHSVKTSINIITLVDVHKLYQ